MRSTHRETLSPQMETPNHFDFYYGIYYSFLYSLYGLANLATLPRQFVYPPSPHCLPWVANLSTWRPYVVASPRWLSLRGFRAWRRPSKWSFQILRGPPLLARWFCSTRCWHSCSCQSLPTESSHERADQRGRCAQVSRCLETGAHSSSSFVVRVCPFIRCGCVGLSPDVYRRFICCT